MKVLLNRLIDQVRICSILVAVSIYTLFYNEERFFLKRVDESILELFVVFMKVFCITIVVLAVGDYFGIKKAIVSTILIILCLCSVCIVINRVPSDKESGNGKIEN